MEKDTITIEIKQEVSVTLLWIVGGVIVVSLAFFLTHSRFHGSLAIAQCGRYRRRGISSRDDHVRSPQTYEDQPSDSGLGCSRCHPCAGRLHMDADAAAD